MLFAATLRGGVAVICVVIGTVAHADKSRSLGPVVSVTGEADQAKQHAEDYSCAEIVAVDRTSPPTPFLFLNEVKYGARPLQLVLQPGPRTHHVLDAFAPKQEFTLYGERFAESPHVTQHATGVFHGSYRLWSTAAPTFGSPLVLRFFETHFPQVAFGSDIQQSYFLLPASQVETVLEILSGLPVKRFFPSAMPAPTTKIQPGLVRTGRGTYYDFDRNGLGVTVYRRGENPKYISLVAEREVEAFASHAAILRRMGVVAPDKLTPAEQIAAAIARNESLLEQAGFDASLRGVLAFAVDQSNEAYARWRKMPANTPYEASTIRKKLDTLVWAALHEANHYVHYAPPALRWYAPSEPELYQAPQGADGSFALRVTRPFLVFGEHLRADSEAEPQEMRVGFERSSLHLQLAHAYLGQFALDLDQHGALGGGVAEFEYDATPPHALRRIEVTDHGYVSYHTGRRQELSATQLHWISRNLQRVAALPWNSPVEVVVESRRK